MAAARDSDISLWLHNKLGTSADTWSEGSICAQLNVEVLRNIKECFVELQTQVKLKLLLSFFHIPKRNVEEVSGRLCVAGVVLRACCGRVVLARAAVGVLRAWPKSAFTAVLTRLCRSTYIIPGKQPQFLGVLFVVLCQLSCYIVHFGIILFTIEISKGIYVYKVKKLGVPPAENPKIGRALPVKGAPICTPTTPAQNCVSKVEVTTQDDDWGKVIFCREPPENQRITHDLITELRKLVKKHSELGLLPMECNYLNRNAFMAAAGGQAPLTKHFALKRKPKAAALRAELLNRSADAQANVKKSQLPTVPVRSRGMPRKMNDTTPLKGIPSRLPGSGLRGSGLGSTPVSRPLVRSTVTRKDGGIKLLDITESPIAVQQAKKRRKLQDTADAKAADAEEKRKEQQQADGKQTTQQPQAQQQQTTPDYAAGLTPSNPPTPGPPTPSTPLLSASAGGASTLHTNAVAVGTIAARSTLQQNASSGGRATPSTPAPPSGASTPQRIIVTPSTQAAGSPTVVYRTVAHTPVFTTAEVVQAATAVTVTPATSEAATTVSQPQYATLQGRSVVGFGGTLMISRTNAVAVGTIAARSTLQQNASSGGRATPSTPAPPSGASTPQRIIVTPSTQAAGSPTVVYRTVAHTPVFTTAEVVQAATAVTVTPATSEAATTVSQPQYATLQPVQPEMVYAATPLTTAALTTPASPAPQQPAQQQQVTQVITVTPQPETQPTQPVPINQAAVATQQQQSQQKRGLSLTREQMLEAQEMFRTSNKVTRPEKALILGFMAGSRENPCPHLGNIVTIKLSEGEETVSQPEGTHISMLAETHFQMNYNTGEWKRIKKYRPLPAE
nr:negative elongation factor A-like [Procambarus clarkii]